MSEINNLIFAELEAAQNGTTARAIAEKIGAKIGLVASVLSKAAKAGEIESYATLGVSIYSTHSLTPPDERVDVLVPFNITDPWAATLLGYKLKDGAYVSRKMAEGGRVGLEVGSVQDRPHYVRAFGQVSLNH